MKKYIIRAVIVLFLAYVTFGWKIPIILRLNSLALPPGCETVYQAKIRISDVYWLHIKGEKVIKCDLGYEAAKEYILTHNSAWKLADIDIYEYAGMSDIAIYDSEFDDEFWKQPDRDHYIKINYFRKLFE